MARQHPVRRRRVASRGAAERRLVVESLESRLALAAIANADIYDGVMIPFTATEDTAFLATGTQSVSNDIVARTSGGWRYFTDITRTSPDDVYPTDSNGGDWRTVSYDVESPRRPGNPGTTFGQWRGPAVQGFANGGVTDIPVGGLNGADVGAGYVGPAGVAVKTTFIARKSFSVSQAQIDSGTLKLNYVCDDGCVFYINGQEVHRINIGTDQVEVNEYAPGASASETFQATPIDIPVAGLNLSTATDGNVLAVEVHNAAPNSSDIGVRVHLFSTSTSVAAPSLYANDTPYPMPATAVGRLLDRNGDAVAGTTVQAFDAEDPNRFAGTVTNFNSATGFFTFTPAKNYSGVATFIYEVDDNPADGIPPSVSAAAITVTPVNDPPVAFDSFYTFSARSSTITVGNRGAALIEASEGDWYFQDDGSDQDTRNGAWNDGPVGGFDPAAAGWKGPAPTQFGFGENDETTVLINSTRVEGNPVDLGALTYYFFRTFDIANPAAIFALEIGLMRDDGAAVYLNGVRVVLDALVEPYTYSTAGISPADDGQNFNRFIIRLADFPTLSLLPTGNHLAVEIHQQSAASSDVSFDLGLYEYQLTTGPDGGSVGVLANDNDVDNDNSELVVSGFDASGAAGQLAVAINPNGTFTVTPASATLTGTFTIPYTVRDPAGATALGNLNITLSPVFPVTADRYVVDEDTTLDAGTAGAATVFLPRSSAGWDFLDSIMNGLEQDPDGTPQDYPVDDGNRQWFHPQFRIAGSTLGPWESGTAPLQAGGISAFPGAVDTLGGMGCGAPVADGNCVTTYLFRRTFSIASAFVNVKTLHLRNIIDDGFRMYINGTEVQRHLLPPGVITTTTYATGNGNEGTAGNLDDNYSLNVEGLLVNGDNVIAVEVHQSTNTSSDVGLDLQLETWSGVLANDGPTSSPPVTAVLVPGFGPTNGFVVVNSDGTFRYTPHPNFNGTDTFQYAASDANRVESISTVTIDVRARPDAPQATADSYFTPANTPLNIFDFALGLLANDTDPDDSTPLLTLRVQQSSIQVSPPTAGTFTLDNVASGLSDGTFTFTPAADFSGIVNVTYTVVDPTGLTSTATAAIQVGFDGGMTIRGAAFDDRDGDGQIELGEPPLAGRTIYLDANGNGQFDAGAHVAVATDVPRAIPDRGSIASTQTVAGLGGTVNDVDVTLTIDHTFNADLRAFLIGPTGLRVELFSSVGGNARGFLSTTLDDEASGPLAAGSSPFTGPFRPKGVLGAFDGTLPNGDWSLEVIDAQAQDVGALVNWSLAIQTTTAGEPNATTGAAGAYAFADLAAGDYRVCALHPLGWTQTVPAAGACRVVTLAAGQTASGVDFASVFTPPPQVTGIAFGSTRGPAIEKAIPVGTGLMQLAPLPWPIVNLVRVTFNSAVVVHPLDLRVTGVEVCKYDLTPGGFQYNSATHTATWQFQRPDGGPLVADRLLVELVSGAGTSGIHGFADSPLDGDWTNPRRFDGSASDTFPSGNGVAGGNFAMRINVLPGDVEHKVVAGANQARQVNGYDFRAMLDRQFTRIGDAAYDSFYDLNGDGYLSIADLVLVQQHRSTLLPEGDPGESCAEPLPAAAPAAAPLAVATPATPIAPLPVRRVPVAPALRTSPRQPSQPPRAAIVDQVLTTSAPQRAFRASRGTRPARVAPI